MGILSFRFFTFFCNRLYVYTQYNDFGKGKIKRVLPIINYFEPFSPQEIVSINGLLNHSLHKNKYYSYTDGLDRIQVISLLNIYRSVSHLVRLVYLKRELKCI